MFGNKKIPKKAKESPLPTRVVRASSIVYSSISSGTTIAPSLSTQHHLSENATNNSHKDQVDFTIIDLSPNNNNINNNPEQILKLQNSFSSTNNNSNINNNNNNDDNNMAQIRSNRKPRGFRPLILLILGFVLIMASVMMIENATELGNTQTYSTVQRPASYSKSGFSSSSSSSSSSFSSSNTRTTATTSSYGSNNFDVNAPPVVKSFWEEGTHGSGTTTTATSTAATTMSNNNGNKKNDNVMDMDRDSFLFWGQQANRMEDQNNFDKLLQKKQQTTTTTSDNNVQQQQPFPIIDENDDAIPIGAYATTPGSFVKASDALMCRDSVVDYVINATDLKDECDGMKKAFTKYCTDNGGGGGGAEKPPPVTTTATETEGTAAQSRRRRRLIATTNTTNTAKTPTTTTASTSTTHRTGNKKSQNMVIMIQHRLRRIRLYLSWWWNPITAKEIMINEIVQEWDHAKSQVVVDDDTNDSDDGDISSRWEQQQNRLSSNNNHNHHRRLLQDQEIVEEVNNNNNNSNEDKPAILNDSTNDDTNNNNNNNRDEDEEEEKEDKDPVAATSAQNYINKTTTAATTTGVQKKPQSLSLPTNMHHLSEKTLGESLMLQQEDMIKASIKAKENSNNNINATTNATTVSVKNEAAVASAAASSKAVSDTVDFVSSVLNDPSSVEARTCCTSILNVFHENCEVDEEEELSDSRLFIAVAVIAVCGMVKSLIRHFQIRWLPEAAGCILVGVAAGWGLTYFPHHDFSFDGKWFLRILVPPIVFEAALSIDKRSFNRHVVPIMMYAFVGTLLATALTAVVVHEGSAYFKGCATIPYIEALTFGSLISSIDPIAVLSVLSNMGMTDTDTIYVVIFGESLLNDGIAIVLFETLKHFLDDNMTVDGDAMLAAAIHFCVVALGSLLVGLSSGICCTVYYWMMHGCQTPLVEVLMFCCWALLPYYVCDGIEWSGIVAVVAAGFVMDMNVVGEHHIDESRTEESPSSGNSIHSRGKGRDRRSRQVFTKEGHLSTEAKTHIGFVTEIIATLMETTIFAYLGLFLFSSRYHWNFYHTLIAIGGCCISRAIMIPTLSTIANAITRTYQVRSASWNHQLPHQSIDSAEKQDKPAGVVIDKKMQLVLWFAGLRGAMSFALVENIPLYDPVSGEGTVLKSELKAMTCACIIFTVFVLGGLTYSLMDSLGMAPKGAGGHKTSLLEKELETIGLLSKQSHDDDDDNITGWGKGGDETIYQQEVQVSPQSQSQSQNSVFRQRLNQG